MAHQSQTLSLHDVTEAWNQAAGHTPAAIQARVEFIQSFQKTIVSYNCGDPQADLAIGIAKLALDADQPAEIRSAGADILGKVTDHKIDAVRREEDWLIEAIYDEKDRGVATKLEASLGHIWKDIPPRECKVRQLNDKVVMLLSMHHGEPQPNLARMLRVVTSAYENAKTTHGMAQEDWLEELAVHNHKYPPIDRSDVAALRLLHLLAQDDPQRIDRLWKTCSQILKLGVTEQTTDIIAAACNVMTKAMDAGLMPTDKQTDDTRQGFAQNKSKVTSAAAAVRRLVLSPDAFIGVGMMDVSVAYGRFVAYNVTKPNKHDYHTAMRHVLNEKSNLIGGMVGTLIRQKNGPLKAIEALDRLVEEDASVDPSLLQFALALALRDDRSLSLGIARSALEIATSGLDSDQPYIKHKAVRNIGRILWKSPRARGSIKLGRVKKLVDIFASPDTHQPSTDPEEGLADVLSMTLTALANRYKLYAEAILERMGTPNGDTAAMPSRQYIAMAELAAQIGKRNKDLSNPWGKTELPYRPLRTMTVQLQDRFIR
ncbi:MAG: hypothetical protein IPI58_07495 [Alphaproteobacteria bacterium]|nr:MAG: hypothetical protein IPI58_07495 [Alphaproteobacteria bacterium]